MKTVTITLALLVSFLAGPLPATAVGFWNPFVKKDDAKKPRPMGNAFLQGGSLSPSASKKYRTNPTSVPTSQKVVNGTVDVLTLKPLRQKIKGSQWSKTPPQVANTQMKKAPKKPSLLSSMFKPKQPQGPRTVEEWLVQKRPPF